MTNANYNFEKQKITTRDGTGKIQSVKPIYDVAGAAMIEAHNLINQIRTISTNFPSAKFMSELNGVPEKDFKELKEDLERINADLTDHGSKFFHQITPNSVLIVHQEI